MWIFNDRALIAVGLGAVASFALFLTTSSRPLAFAVGMLLPMAIDVWMRFHSEDCDRPLIHPNAGAHIWFVPVWGVGLILGIILGLMYFNLI